MNVVRFVNVTCAGLVAGAMLMELGLVLPSLRSVSNAALVEVHRNVAPRAAKSIPIFGALATISAPDLR